MATKTGQIDSAHFDGGGNIVRGGKASKDTPDLGTALAGMQWTPVPANVETAALTLATNSVIQDWDLVTALNAVLTTELPSGERLALLGTLEFVNGEAATNNATYSHGDAPDGDDTERAFATAAAAASEFVRGEMLFTDEDGNIRASVDDVANLTLVFHLEAYAVCRTASGS